MAKSTGSKRQAKKAGKKPTAGRGRPPVAAPPAVADRERAELLKRLHAVQVEAVKAALEAETVADQIRLAELRIAAWSIREALATTATELRIAAEAITAAQRVVKGLRSVANSDTLDAVMKKLAEEERRANALAHL